MCTELLLLCQNVLVGAHIEPQMVISYELSVWWCYTIILPEPTI
jgi:hypothetical protein